MKKMRHEELKRLAHVLQSVDDSSQDLNQKLESSHFTALCPLVCARPPETVSRACLRHTGPLKDLLWLTKASPSS